MPAVKGQAIPAYDPRALKGNGVTYVTSPMGADHTAGNAFETLKYINPIGREKQVESSRRLQIRAALLDSLGLCLFTRPPFIRKPHLLRDLLRGCYGDTIDAVSYTHLCNPRYTFIKQHKQKSESWTSRLTHQCEDYKG